MLNRFLTLKIAAKFYWIIHTGRGGIKCGRVWKICNLPISVGSSHLCSDTRW